MRVLADTNILLRLTDDRHGHGVIALRALGVLRDRGDQLVIIPQVAAEFWRVATGGGADDLKLDLAEADRRLGAFEAAHVVLPEIEAAYPVWRRLVLAPGVRGKQVFDARIAALMAAHGLTHVLTFNAGDFARYPGVTPLDPIGLS